MRATIIFLVSATLLLACSPTQLLSKALMKNVDADLAYAEQQRLEQQKYRSFYCSYATLLPVLEQDTFTTQRAIAAHNEKWTALCQRNLPASQPNNLE